MNDASLSKSGGGREDVFKRLVETVFVFIHQHYGDFNAILEKYQINYSQYACLLTVYMYGSLSEGDLAKMLFINPSTVSRMVYALEERGWLKSCRDKADRRKVLVTLSASGKRRINGMISLPAEVMARLANELDEKKREYVYEVAEIINQALGYMISEEQ